MSLTKIQTQKIALLKKKYCITSLSQKKLANKRVIVRIDANVPLQNGKITDDTRLLASLPPIRYLLKQKVKQIILISHLGRPKGVDPQKSLAPIAKRFEELLKRKVSFCESHKISDYNQKANRDKTAKILVLENLRFDEGEGMNTITFAKKIAAFGDIYINDAFGTAHRKHASNNAITKLLPSYIGLLIAKEITELTTVVSKPKRPFVVLVGFAKISDKITILTKLLENADTVLIGGAISQTFFLAQGKEIGKSLVETDSVPLAKKLIKKYADKIVLPIDLTCASTLSAKTQVVVTPDKIPKEKAVFDIGPKTTELFANYIQNANNVFWNGPMGVFEIKPYDTQTNELIKILSKSKAHSIIGGGDTATAINKSGMAQTINHISTGGGASLSYLQNPILPAFTAIIVSHKK